jgi:hypothetical protein
MNFGQAIEILKHGGRVARSGWNGKGMFLFLVNPAPNHDPSGVGVALGDEVMDMHPLPQLPFICMKTAQDTVNVGWLASQTDMLAEDWEQVSATPSVRDGKTHAKTD